jgi:hypothetical protein
LSRSPVVFGSSLYGPMVSFYDNSANLCKSVSEEAPNCDLTNFQRVSCIKFCTKASAVALLRKAKMQYEGNRGHHYADDDYILNDCFLLAIMCVALSLR